MRAARAAALLLTLAAAVLAQDPPSGESAFAAWEKGLQELRNGHAALAAEQLSLAAGALPKMPDLLYALARAEALAGRPDRALAALEGATALGFGVGADREAAFASLRKEPRFRALLPRIAANAEPVSSGKLAFTIPEPDLIPEGAAWDARTETLYVGSLHRHKIVAVDRTGRVRDFVQPGQDGLLQVLGMKVDSEGRALWACSAEGDEPQANANRRSVLFRFDLATGRLLGSYNSPARGKHLFNDLVVTRGGGVFLTDSEDGSVWRLRPGRDSLELFAPPGSLVYPNGIAISEGEELLYVAHASGIAVWKIGSGERFELPAPGDVTLAAADGLYLHRGSLIAVQNGLQPQRIAAFALSPQGDRVLGCRVLERANPVWEIPTTGAVAGDAFYYMANTQLRALAPGNIVTDPEKRKPVAILRLELPR